MSPQTEQIRIPPKLAMVQRPTHEPRAERPTVRSADGRCWAVVDALRLEQLPD